ncbi:MAG TPA: ABC transporter ATP-binding protein [Bacillota bacterium]|nr:ABC transporter ATP-binding protein [Bacillota bacterium]HRX91241.1 ABC transporter ATP-binding protein [Candidatus Izemoplasmatales bacterium]
MPRGYGGDIERHRTYSDKTIISRLLVYVKPFIKQFVTALVMALIVVGLDLIGPLLISDALDSLGEETIVFARILLIVGIYFAATAIGAIISYKQTILLQTTGQKVIYDIRADVFQHIESLSIETYNHMPIGKLVTRVTSDIDTLNMLYTDVIINLFRNAITIIGVFVIMFFLDWKLTLLVLVVVPFIVLASFLFRKYARKAYRNVRNDLANINAFLSEHLTNMKLIQIFNREDRKFSEFKRQNQKLNRSYLQQTFTFGIYRPLMYLLYVVALMIILWQGSLDTMLQIITFGVLYAFTQYINKFFNPIQDLAEKYDTLQAAFTAGERIFEIMDTSPLVKDDLDAIDIESLKGKIEFRHVWFAYDNEDWILKDVSFIVKPGETLALVGATGSGKTTIINLIVRNYDIQKGEILIDDIDIRKIRLASLRSKIGQMPQDVFLFSGTVESNIRMRDESIEMDKVVQSAKYVNASHFIEKLPGTYLEPVRERGNNFSAGERQLLSFARTVAHDPSVMILDEATANIDTETEALIQESLGKMMNIGTMIVVAHRLSTIQHADCIIVMQKGKIVESGNHHDLLRKKGYYFGLYQLQYERPE